MPSIVVSPIARSVPFDNSTNGFIATEVQSAIEETYTHALRDRFFLLFGFDGTASSGRWLEGVGNVPSDGPPVVFPTSCVLKELSISVVSNATTTISIYKNGTVTIVASISLTATKTNYVINLNVAFAAGDTLGVKVTSGSSSRPVVGVFLHSQ